MPTFPWPVVLVGAQGASLVKMVGSTGWVVQLVLLLLLGMSVGTWAIIGYKLRRIRRAAREDESFSKLFWESKRLDAIFEASRPMVQSPVAHVFRSAYQEMLRMPKAQRGKKSTLTAVVRALRRATMVQTSALESQLNFLATTASAAPFIGLFGTVWGIMDAFAAIGAAGSPNIAVVAPHIAEALIATAVGLFAAIPAVIGYNTLNHRVKGMEEAMDVFATDLLNILEGYFSGAEDEETPSLSRTFQ